MKLLNIIILLFVLSAFTIGISLSDSSVLTPNNISEILDQTNLTQIELSRVSSSEVEIINVNGFLSIVESYVRFIITFALEIMKMGISFGYDNPDYFEPSFIFQIIKLIVILTIIGLLIKPVTYGIVLLILLGIWIKDIVIKNKSNSIKRTKKLNRRK